MNTPHMAAQAWAQAHAGHFRDPVEFGRAVAMVEAATRLTAYHAGDEAAMAAAVAALSVRPEVLQAIAQLSGLTPLRSGAWSQTERAGAEA